MPLHACLGNNFNFIRDTDRKPLRDNWETAAVWAIFLCCNSQGMDINDIGSRRKLKWRLETWIGRLCKKIKRSWNNWIFICLLVSLLLCICFWNLISNIEKNVLRTNSIKKKLVKCLTVENAKLIQSTSQKTLSSLLLYHQISYILKEMILTAKGKISLQKSLSKYLLQTQTKPFQS